MVELCACGQAHFFSSAGQFVRRVMDADFVRSAVITTNRFGWLAICASIKTIVRFVNEFSTPLGVGGASTLVCAGSTRSICFMEPSAEPSAMVGGHFKFRPLDKDDVVPRVRKAEEWELRRPWPSVHVQRRCAPTRTEVKRGPNSLRPPRAGTPALHLIRFRVLGPPLCGTECRAECDGWGAFQISAPR